MIPLNEITVSKVELCESSRGVVYRGTRQINGKQEEIAIKVLSGVLFENQFLLSDSKMKLN